MNLRGTVLDAEQPRTISTRHGDREIVTIRLSIDTDETVLCTLWGKWVDSASNLSPGMTILITAVCTSDFQVYDGEHYETTTDSYVIIEPNRLVDVTAIRSWVQCPRMYYLNKITGVPLNYPVVKGTLVHEVFDDILRGIDPETAIDQRIAEHGVELGLLDIDASEVRADAKAHAAAISGWLEQGTLTESDEWLSECTLVSRTFGLKGRVDAIRRGVPVELKTGKNVKREPRFPDKIQAACYALMLGDEYGITGPITADRSDTGTLLYTKNATVDRADENGDLSPAKDFSIKPGLLEFVVRTRNEIVAMEYDFTVPTGFEGNAKCDFCFEQDTCLVISGRLNQRSKAGQIGTPLPKLERETFHRLYRAIERERYEVHREYIKLLDQSASERAMDDRALIDLSPVECYPDENGRWITTARRRSKAVSKLREGDLALISDGDPITGESVLGKIIKLSETVSVSVPEPIDMRRIDVYPSDIGENRRLVALHDAILKGDPRRKSILFGNESPTFGDSHGAFIQNNPAQNRAVEQAINARDFSLIHGPPGTGKTFVIAKIVQAAVNDGQRVMLSAYTNRAVDNALEAVIHQGVSDVLRYGTESGIRADMLKYRFQPEGTPNERVRELESAQVVASTTSSASSRTIRTQQFDLAIIDEAAQITMPDTFAAINRADRFILVGDQHQLPPVVRADTELDRSLFEDLIERFPEAGVLLDRQYRMNQRIQAFSSREFYNGRLRPATDVIARQTLRDIDGLTIDALPEDLTNPVVFIDTHGDDGSNTDETEVQEIIELIKTYLEIGMDPHDIGVIAPYRAQVSLLTEAVPPAIQVDTVDRFQGSSKEIIIVSFVESDEIDSPIFEDYRRLNVALTRAKKALVLVGSGSALRTDPVYDRMVTWAQSG